MDTPEHLSKRLIEDGEKTLAYFRDLPREYCNQTVYTDGSCWTLRQVLAHLVAAEKSLTRLISNILGGGKGTPEDFELNVYNERKVAELQDVSMDELVERFGGLRRETVALVAGLQPADLSLMGRHPFLGVAPLAEIIKMIYRHNQIHIREVRRVLSDS